jgi:hypothetical protein
MAISAGALLICGRSMVTSPRSATAIGSSPTSQARALAVAAAFHDRVQGEERPAALARSGPL